MTRARFNPLTGGLAAAVLALSAAAGAEARAARASGPGSAQSQSAAALIQATAQASETAKSVQVAGSMRKGNLDIGLNLKMAAGGGASGWIAENGERFSLVLDGPTLYISGSEAFWRHFSNAKLAKLLAGKWFRTPDKGSWAGITRIAVLSQFFHQLLDHHGPLVKTAPTTVQGQRVIGLRDTRKGGILYVRASGSPYPVELDGNTGSTTGKLLFTGFNQPIKITPPAHSVTLSQLQKQAGG
jgi:hypothetical protein